MSVDPPKSVLEKRQEIVDAAVRLANLEGIEAVSMRRLAETLSLGTMTLYSYVADKDELVELMRDEIARKMLVPEPLPEDWKEALGAIAISTREAIEANSWIFGGAAPGPSFRINMVRHIEQSMAVVQMLGVDPETGRNLLMAVDDYVFGHCLRVQRRRVKGGGGMQRREGDGPPLDPEVAAAIEAGELPLFSRIFGPDGGRGPSAVPPESDFEQGLQWLLDGIAADLDSRG